MQRSLRASAPLFIKNVGQFDPEARFLVRGGGGALWLADDALWLTILEPAPARDPRRDRFLEDGPRALGIDDLEEPRQGVHLRLIFEGANPAALAGALLVAFAAPEGASEWREEQLCQGTPHPRP